MGGDSDDGGDGHFAQLLGSANVSQIPPPLETANSESSQKAELDDDAINDPSTYLASLRALKTGMDQHELELLKKKTIEVSQVTKQKVHAMTDSIKQMFLHKPSQIGVIPGLDDQVTLAFNLWLSHLKPAMLLDPAIAADYNGFARRLMSLQRNRDIWRNFVEQWRMARILFDDDFGRVFDVVKEGLRIQPIVAPQAAQQQQVSEEKNDL